MNETIIKALQAFREGKLVAAPTETVYGLTAPIDKPELIEKIFTIKQRPFSSALSIQVSTVEMAKMYTDQWSQFTQNLVQKYWPGPLTLVVKSNDKISNLITANTGFVGLRMPDQNLTLELIKHLGVPIAAPSANPHTLPAPTNAQQVRSYFKEEDVYIIDGGPCTFAKESTIIKIIDDEIEFLRIGAISKTEIESFLYK
ncbi:MAG: threonylcarbamoyl-AMP synthase [Bdellovibrionales bacterium]|nr:threonylcarbamoyl-AMP synthase [Bdellovibrionales bacterium]